ncbi:MAG TPA: hypothetical protein VHA56_12590 [Mucilaginibacter sp.]|nr:hypothetical protein [Mucilaginibacter sp.]
MQTILIEKLRSYIVANNPDILLHLQQDFSLTRYLEDKVSAVIPLAEQLIAEGKPLYAVEELCLNEMTSDLRPSKYLYIKELLEEDFLAIYNRFREMGVLTYEIVNILEACKPVFERTGFTETNQDDRALRYAVMGTIQEYLEE